MSNHIIFTKNIYTLLFIIKLIKITSFPQKKAAESRFCVFVIS
jgi:hypothetical protein